MSDDSYHRMGILDVVEHNENNRTFLLDDTLYPQPGQFAMVWVPEFGDEKPISFSGRNHITVQKVGPFTEKMFTLEQGDTLYLRGPYGDGFPKSRIRSIVGGGCGIAPLHFLFEEGKKDMTGVVLAGRTKSDIIFLDDFIGECGEHNVSLEVMTEDGSFGEQGIATNADIEGLLGDLAICGPEKMMQAVAELYNNQGDVWVSVERYMKCAVGLCGACSFSGYRVCVDGPVFPYEVVQKLPHWGKVARDRTGELKPI